MWLHHRLQQELFLQSALTLPEQRGCLGPVKFRFLPRSVSYPMGSSLNGPTLRPTHLLPRRNNSGRVSDATCMRSQLQHATNINPIQLHINVQPFGYQTEWCLGGYGILNITLPSVSPLNTYTFCYDPPATVQYNSKLGIGQLKHILRD